MGEWLSPQAAATHAHQTNMVLLDSFRASVTADNALIAELGAMLVNNAELPRAAETRMFPISELPAAKTCTRAGAIGRATHAP